MIALFDAGTGAKVGRITEQQLQALIGWMEEEDSEDREYYLTAEDCELMEEQGVDPTLIEVLRAALRRRDDMDLRYEAEA
jgi:hypothetical protein